MSHSDGPGAPIIAPDIEEQPLAAEVDAAAAHIPSSDEELAEDTQKKDAKGKNAEEADNKLRIMQDRMDQMETVNNALQPKLNAREKHIENLMARLQKFDDKTEEEKKPDEPIKIPQASTVEAPTPPDDVWLAAASTLPARRPQPVEEAKPDPTGLEAKFQKLLEVVQTQNPEIAAMRADMQSWQGDWQNYPASAQAFPTAPTTPWPPTTSTSTTTRAGH